jgi:hypothetical protein
MVEVEDSHLGDPPIGGLNPTTPQNDAGILIEPPMSEPVASVAVPAASAAADPPLEPPGEYPVCHGLRVTPQSRDQVTGAQENSGVDLPDHPRYRAMPAIR